MAGKDLDVAALIRKYAIKNAIDYGKADVGSVLGKVIPQAKGTPVPELKKEVEAVVKEVNKMKKAELEKAYEPFEEEFEERAKAVAEKTARPNLEIEGAVKGEVITRISPGPNGYMHIGHVKQALLSSEVANLYDGKLYRYFDDTNPEACKQEYVDAMMRDHEWLGLKFAKTYYASDFVDTIYKYAKILMEKGKGYVCTCDRDKMQKERFAGEECEHRKQTVEENEKLFKRMLDGEYDEGEAVLRYKGDMKAHNTILRDPVMLRIVEAPHYRVGTKYRVWPVYDFNTPIVDSLQGITDIIRSKEYELHDELGEQILKALGLRVPRMHLEARLNIRGNITQKRDIRELIETGKISGWDDPRLMTIMALRRRGITPEAIRNFVMHLGMTKTDSTVPFDMLLAENRRIIDTYAKHLFFVPDPVEVTAHGAENPVRLKLHPSMDIWYREYKVGDKFYVPKEDSGFKLVLKDSGASVPGTKGAKEKIVQWVADRNYIKCSVLVPGDLVDKYGKFNPDSLNVVEGYVESYAEKLKEHEIVQFERFGYCILDDKKKMQFIFISK